ncbi:hypothetical protein [uncultured Gammaproteobacteria bacterium]|nr:hypothetical protein [uncultured Gammaproteobacteria bacterium]
MKKILLLSALLSIISTNSLAEFQPYIGVSMNSFSLNGDGLSTTDLNSGFGSTSDPTRDTGTAIGFTAGALLNDTKKINLSYFTGKEDVSSVFTVTTTSISVDHSFNNEGVHHGWFLGAGLSSVEIKNKPFAYLDASSFSGVGPLIRGGYEYKYSNQMFWTIGFNLHLTDIDYKFKKMSSSDAGVSTKFDVSNLRFSLNYIF